MKKHNDKETIEKYKKALELCKQQRNTHLQRDVEHWSVKGEDTSKERAAYDEEINSILNQQDSITNGEDEFESMDIRTKPGSKVIYSGKNGFDSERDEANKIFIVGKEYTVESIHIDGWSSLVFFKEFPQKAGFNTAMFKNVK